MKKSEAYIMQVLLSGVNNKLLEFLYSRLKYRYRDDLNEAFELLGNDRALEPIHKALSNVEDSSTFHYKLESLTQALHNEFTKRNLDEYQVSSYI